MQAFVGDIGYSIVYDFEENISDFEVSFMKVKKPNGILVEWPVELFDNTSIICITREDDLDVAGIYEFQAYIRTPSWEGHGERRTMSVYDTL